MILRRQEYNLPKHKNWNLKSWKKKKALQQPIYKNDIQYNKVLNQLESYPPIIFSGELETLKKQIGEAGSGNRFIAHGGDCVERFIDCNEQTITNKIKILLQMSIILTHAARKPVIRIGRIAGQFSKPRSNKTETAKGKTIPTYKGDNINGFTSTEESRTPDPNRLLQGFHFSVITLNYIRAMIDGGFTDLHQPYNWNLYTIEKTDKWKEYKNIVEHVLDAIHFMESFGGVNPEKLGRIDFYTSHEGLHLGYEEALTRKNDTTGEYYNSGAHMLWIGERTRDIHGAHVEYFKGLTNPIGIKIGPSIEREELQKLISILNPGNEKGRITLISRFGKKNVAKKLPEVIKAVQDTNIHVTWSCDPMHGNTVKTKDNYKTRDFNNILEELELSFNIHKNNDSCLGGVHFELTGEDVTECTGGAMNLKDKDLNQNYQTYCDPRLNYTQSMEMAFLISRMLKKNKS